MSKRVANRRGPSRNKGPGRRRMHETREDLACAMRDAQDDAERLSIREKLARFANQQIARKRTWANRIFRRKVI